MKTFRVQQTHFLEKKAYVSVEAETPKQAIDKARALQWEEFDQREVVEQTQWKLVPGQTMTFFERLLFLFTGNYN